MVQNINGQSKFLFVLNGIFFTLFKKYFFKNKVISHLFFFIGLLILILIYLMQSRLNILSSFIFLFFLIFTIKDLNFIKKLIYLLIIVILPILSFNFYTDTSNRFIVHVKIKYSAFPSAETKRDEVVLFEEKDNETEIKILTAIEGLTITTNESVTTKADQSVTTKADQNVTTKADQSVTTKADQNVTTKADQSVTTKADQNVTTKADQNVTTKADQNVTTKADIKNLKLL